MRVCILGHFGGKRKYNDGQTVKTIAIYEAMVRWGGCKIDKIDTYYFKHNLVGALWQFFKALFKDKKYIVLLSSNGRKMLFPILSAMSQLLGKEIYHYGIGGRLAREVNERPIWKKYLLSFKSNWMESVELADKLQHQGVINAIYLPNFKKLQILKKEELRQSYNKPYKLCTFSRVMEQKGIEDAINAVRTINEEQGYELVSLDIYGPIEEDYEKQFFLSLENGQYCEYKGIVPATESVSVLKDYFLLLFPTHYRHEGIPGTIIDGLSAGIPVVSRQWQYCNEILQHKKTAYIYNFDEPEKLKDMILYAVNHYDETIAMKSNCVERAYIYSEDYVIRKIVNQMNLENGYRKK